MALTSLIRQVEVLDTSATDGSGLTGKAHTDFTAKYCVDGGTLISLTTETITTLGTYQAPTSSAHIRIKELNSADPTKGMYEVHFHNDQLTSGTRLWLYMSVTGGKVQRLEVDLQDVKSVNVTQFGGTNGTFSGGRPEVNTTHLAGTAYASADLSSTMKASVNAEVDQAIADAALATASELAKVPKSDGTVAFNATAVAGMQSGLATASALATAQSDLDILTGTDGVTLATAQPNYTPATSAQATAIEADTQDLQTQIGTAGAGLTALGDTRLGNLDAAVSTRLASASYTAPLDAAGTRTAVGLSSANLDTQLGNIVADTQDLQTQIGTAGAGLTALGDTRLGNLDAAVSTRLASASYTAPLDAAGTRTAVGLASANLDTQLGNIVADTNELQADWADGGRLDLILDARASQTSVDTIDNFLDTEIAAILEDTGTTLPAQIAAITTTQLTEGYAADGVAPTLEEATFMILQSLHEFAITGTSRTAKKLDGTTTAMVFTLDSDTAPTSTTRSA